METTVRPVNVLEIAMDEGSLNMFVQAARGTDLGELLAGEGTFTVLAPIDSAFQQYSNKTIHELLQDKNELKTLLSYHVIPGKYSAADLQKMDSVETLLGSQLSTHRIAFSDSDIQSSNGILHVISSVLLPE